MNTTIIELLKLLIPILSLCIGYFLSQLAGVKTRRKDDNKKKKRILYLLLDMRYQILQKINLDENLDKGIKILIEEFKKKIGIQETDETISSLIKPSIENAVKGNITFEDPFPKINAIVDELSEIDPILAYQLKGAFNYSQQRFVFKAYMDDVTNRVEEEPPAGVMETMENFFSKDMVKDIEESIKHIAATVDRKMKKDISKTLAISVASGVMPEELTPLLDQLFIQLENLVKLQEEA